MKILKVGCYLYDKPQFLPECFSFTYSRTNGYFLLISMQNPTPQEVNDIKTGDIRFGLLVVDKIIFFLAKFGNLHWSDSSYNYWSLPPQEQTVPNISTGQRVLLQIVLVNARDSKIEVIRAVTLSPVFSQQLVTAIQEQANSTPISEAQYDSVINKVYRKYPTTDAMLKDALIDNTSDSNHGD